MRGILNQKGENRNNEGAFSISKGEKSEQWGGHSQSARGKNLNSEGGILNQQGGKLGTMRGAFLISKGATSEQWGGYSQSVREGTNRSSEDEPLPPATFMAPNMRLFTCYDPWPPPAPAVKTQWGNSPLLLPLFRHPWSHWNHMYYKVLFFIITDCKS